jgi:hypothetical protein
MCTVLILHSKCTYVVFTRKYLASRVKGCKEKTDYPYIFDSEKLAC